MHNPFDPNKNQTEFEFYNNMTTAINKFMITQYPDFDTHLSSRIREINILHGQFQQKIENFDKILDKYKKETLECIKTEINTYIREKYPQLSNQITHDSQELRDQIKKNEKIAKEASEKLKKCTPISSFYDDFYRVKDDMKDLKTRTEKLLENLQKAFK